MSEAIIEIKNCEYRREVFQMICDGFIKSNDTSDGYIQMDIYSFRYNSEDQDKEPLFCRIEVANEIEDKAGDYLPFDLDKEDLGQLINFLKDIHSKM